MPVKFLSINVNGLNAEKKQRVLNNFLFRYGIDVICIQEHNVSNVANVSIIGEYYHTYINTCYQLKGGTAILIRKNSGINIVRVELHASSRIMHMKCELNNVYFDIINVYAHSGSNFKKERETLFSEEMLYYLQNNLDNTLLVGDFNCIISPKDSTSNASYLNSDNLKNICNNLNLYDAHNIYNKGLVQYTYIKRGYGSRIDRIYVNKLKNNILQFDTIPVEFSDHHAVLVKVDIANVYEIQRQSYWKLNASLLDDLNVYELFQNSWNVIKDAKNGFNNVLEWWDFAKTEVATLFQKVGKQLKAQKFGLLSCLEEKMKYYNYKHQSNPDKGYPEIIDIKAKLNKIKSESYEGLRIRARIEDKIHGEKLSSYLIKKQKIRADNYIAQLDIFDNIITNQKAIIYHATRFYENLYEASVSDIQNEIILLDTLESVISEDENISLIAPILEQEVLAIIKKLNQNKAPGEDGLCVEFYLK